MRSLTLGSLALCLSTTILAAQPVALIIGNEDYARMGDVRGADEVADISRQLADQSVSVISARNARGSEFQRALRAFEDRADDAETLIVVLSGAFVHSATDVYFLPTDANEPGIADLDGGDAIRLSTIGAYLASRPGSAFLVLAEEDDRGANDDPFLRNGIGVYRPPQGVAVVRGDVRGVTDFLEDTLVRPGAVIRAGNGVVVRGFSPDDQSVLPEPRQAAVAPPRADDDDDKVLLAADVRLWQRTKDLDTADAYRRYLQEYPNGLAEDQARQRLAELERSPEDRARAAEQALNLNRDARRQIQRDLSILDYNTRGIDGIFGNGTRDAIRRWQGEQGVATTGFLNRNQIERLGRQATRRGEELEAEAERRRRQQQAQDRAYWDETVAINSEDRYRDYLQRFPDGEFAEQAKNRLDRIETAKRREANSADREQWDRARRRDTVAAYRAYLNDSPDGRFRGEARERIRALRADEDSADRNREAQRIEDALNLTPTTRRVIEQRLDRAGFNPGTIDGQFDRNARRAIRQYQSSRGLQPTGYLSDAVVVRLLADSVRSIFQ